MNLGVIFGGSSNEHEVSVVSASSIIKNLDKKKYNITYISAFVSSFDLLAFD